MELLIELKYLPNDRDNIDMTYFGVTVTSIESSGNSYPI